MNLNWPLMSDNITRKDLDSIIDYLKQDDPKLTNGPKVRQFEKKWSDWLGVKHSVMVNSGSSANDLTMLALKEIVGGGEIIVPPLTWVSDISSVIHAGFNPKFVDISPTNFALDTEKVIESLTPNTKAVFLTHILGFNGLTRKLLDELESRGIPLIEDVCESHGAEFESRKLGSIGFASNFSFYYAHHITTIEGGMICTNNDELYEIAMMMRAHGMVREAVSNETKEKFSQKFFDLNPDFIFAFPAHNMRPIEINGILGMCQLERLDENIQKRNKNFVEFLKILDKDLFRTDFDTEGMSNYALILILQEPSVTLRNQVESKLKECGIEFRRGLSGGGNQLRQPYLKKITGLPSPEVFLQTEHVHNFGWYIGNFPELEFEKISILAKLLNELKNE
jgi:CDP-4-dehydro-6-deoxyglucose reductase, E1